MSTTFLSFIDKFVKQYKIRKNGAVLLVFYYLLILFEVKDAYLIDHMSFPSIERLEEMLFYIHTYYQKICEPYAIDCFRLDQVVSILLLGDDIFLVNEKVRKDKVFVPLRLINLNDRTKGSALQHLSPVEDEDIRRKILSLLDSESLTRRGKRCLIRSVDQNNPVFQEIGAPLLAGFLLGYPYMYWASCIEGRYEESSNLLSYSTLRKASLYLEVVKEEELMIKEEGSTKKENTLFTDIFSSLMLNRCNVSEFTVPESLMDEEVEGVIRDWITERSAKFQEVANLLCMDDRCRLDSLIETVQTESISL